jgi:alkanesulfonate monooxygenase SsuD/methylene tetrahydromethanopterin reductase-like flavin-dependent oxidoreductase (luciferase family)
MKFGVAVPVGLHGELDGLSNDPREQFAVILGWAKRLEASGFDALHVPDHLLTNPTVMNSSVFECWTTLVALAGVTEHIQLGQNVNCAPFRNPGLLAKITSNLDVISGGRLLWAVGAGWFEPEFDAYGYTFGSPGARVDALRETLQIVLSMWQQPSTSFDGKYYSVTDARCDPKPLQKPRPPVWVGGHGPRVITTAVRYADTLLSGGNEEVFVGKLRVLEERCEAEGRDPATIGRAWLGRCEIADSERQLRERYERGKRKAAERQVGGDLEEAWKKLFDENFEAYRAKFIVGTPAQVVEKLEWLQSVGVGHVVLHCDDFPGTETIDALAAEVMPHFRQAI